MADKMSSDFGMIQPIDFEKEVCPTTNHCRKPTISLLLGAGFSQPMGYPMGKEVNDLLTNFDFKHTDISSTGLLFPCSERNMPYSQYHRNFEFCHRIIDYYTKCHNGNFDYEEFIDFIHSKDIYDKQYVDNTKGVIKSNEDYAKFVFGMENIVAQMIESVIKDKDGNIWYDNKPHRMGPIDGYNIFLQVLSNWSNDHIINVHTLNHDMVFESFDKTDYLSGKICDGFSINGSKYFGEIKTFDGRYYDVRLSRYTGKYDKPVRLFKLHGSLDYALYYAQKKGTMVPDKCIKTRYGIDITKLKCDNSHKQKYDDYQGTYHSYFLSGIVTKQRYYDDKGFFTKIHTHFHKNLKTAKKLIIIGYGGRDPKINEAIFNNYNYRKRPTIIIDPFPSESLIKLAERIGCNIIKKGISEITMADLQ